MALLLLALVVLLTTPRPAGAASSAADEEEGGVLTDVALELYTAGRWRDADIFSLELGGQLWWRSIFLGGSYLPWAPGWLESWPVEVSSVALTLGWQPRLWRVAGWHVAPRLTAVAERVSLRRSDLPEDPSHAWDFGTAVDLVLTRELSRRVRLGLRAGLLWFPESQNVEIHGGFTGAVSRYNACLAVLFNVGI